MPRSGSRPSTVGCRSCRSLSKLDIIRKQKQYLEQWYNEGLKPILKELHYAEVQTTVDFEKASSIVRGVEEGLIETIKKFLKPIKDIISAKNKKNRESLNEKERRIMNEQNRLKNFIEREEAKCKRDSSEFDIETFLAEAERLKLRISKLAIRESAISVSRVRVNKKEEAVDKIHNQARQALSIIKPDELFEITETEKEHKARVTTPPDSCTSTTGSRSRLFLGTSTLTPQPPPRAKSACSSRPKSSLRPTSWSMDATKPSMLQRYDPSTSDKLKSSGEDVSKIVPDVCSLSGVDRGKCKPTISVSPQIKSSDNSLLELDRPFGVGVLSSGERAVVETDALKIIDRDTNEVVRSINLYDRTEAKATGCCDLTVLPNDDIIVCDSRRRKLILVRAGEDRYEGFVAFDEGIIPKSIANDGKILYICLSRESEDGIVERMDIETRQVIGCVVLRPPAGSRTRTGASVCTHSEPKYVAVNNRQELLVSDALNGVLWLIDDKDSVRCLTRVDIPGLSRPTGVCWLDPARFVVAVQDASCHQLFVVHITDTHHVDVVNRYGRRGDQSGEFNSPEGMTVHRGHDHSELLVCDLMNSRLNPVPLSFLEDASSV